MSWLEILLTLVVLLISMKLFGFLKNFGSPAKTEDPFMWEAERQLLEALDSDDLQKFKEIFERYKFEPNHVCRTKNPLLHRAIAKKHSIPFIEYLLSKGADINFSQGTELLIKRGAKLDTEFPQMFGMNCLDVACYYQNYEIVYLLLKYRFTTKELRERHEIFKQKYPDQVNLIDEKVQQLMDYFDKYLPSTARMFLLRKVQQRDPQNTQLAKYSTLLAELLPGEFLEIAKYYTPSGSSHLEGVSEPQKVSESK